jgi:hypothetical protein
MEKTILKTNQLTGKATINGINMAIMRDTNVTQSASKKPKTYRFAVVATTDMIIDIPVVAAITFVRPKRRVISRINVTN